MTVNNNLARQLLVLDLEGGLLALDALQLLLQETDLKKAATIGHGNICRKNCSRKQ